MREIVDFLKLSYMLVISQFDLFSNAKAYNLLEENTGVPIELLGRQTFDFHAALKLATFINCRESKIIPDYIFDS